MMTKGASIADRLTGLIRRDQLRAALAAIIGILAAGGLAALAFGEAGLPLIVAPIGASAVLVFAVPASPLAQPWPVIGGNTLSAAIGLVVAHLVADPLLATGLAVGAAIAVMALTRSLHPPGGAAALTAALGGPVVAAHGWLFPLLPVGLNSVLLVLAAMAFHRLSGHSYPHRAQISQPVPAGTRDEPPFFRIGANRADIEAALADLSEAYDIAPDDLADIIGRVELKAVERSHGDLLCGQIMSRDVISVRADQTAGEARALLISGYLRVLPVRDADGRLIGIVGLRELEGRREADAMPWSAAVTARPSDPALSLVPALTDGRHHAVIITDEAMRPVGIIAQTDLLAALARSLALATPSGGERANVGGLGI